MYPYRPAHDSDTKSVDCEEMGKSLKDDQHKRVQHRQPIERLEQELRRLREGMPHMRTCTLCSVPTHIFSPDHEGAINEILAQQRKMIHAQEQTNRILLALQVLAFMCVYQSIHVCMYVQLQQSKVLDKEDSDVEKLVEVEETELD